MGLYTISCPKCNIPFQWFSGGVPQECPTCLGQITMTTTSNDAAGKNVFKYDPIVNDFVWSPSTELTKMRELNELYQKNLLQMAQERDKLTKRVVFMTSCLELISDSAREAIGKIVAPGADFVLSSLEKMAEDALKKEEAASEKEAQKGKK